MVANPTQCPLCRQPNECQLCTIGAYKGPCWCAKVKIPDELIARVPTDAINRSCICRKCVMDFYQGREPGTLALKALPGEFYFENGLMVFTSAYHLRRGYCCGNGCRNCPF